MKLNTGKEKIIDNSIRLLYCLDVERENSDR